MLTMGTAPAGTSPRLSARLTNIEHWLWIHPTVALSIASTAIAVCSLMVALSALRVQRRNLRLAQQTASRAGRLQSISAVTELVEGRYRQGFKVINGPDAITISGLTLEVRYLLARPDGAGIRNDKRLIFFVHADGFRSIGISGPDLPLRLEPYHPESWLLPNSALQLPRTVDSGKITYAQCISLSLEVEAAGQIFRSNEIGIGDEHQALLGFKSTEKWAGYSLDEVLNATKVTYGDGHRWTGLHQWLSSLMTATSHDE